MDYTTGGVLFQLYPLERKKRPATLICYQVGSERRRDTFKGDMEAAEKHCKGLAKQLTSGDVAIHLSPLDKRVWLETKATATKIGRAPDAICRDYLEALQILGPGGNLLEAAREWKRNHRLGLPKASVATVVEELLTSLEGKRRFDVTIRALRTPLERLATALSMNIDEVKPPELELWLKQYLGKSPRTQNNYITAVVRLFNYAKGRYLPKDASTAADSLERVSDDRRGGVAIWQPWELSCILAHAPDQIRFMLALGAFAGLRTIELHRLDWSSIHLPELPDENGKVAPVAPDYPHGYIDVKGNVAKQHRTAARRLVALQPNLVSFLEDARLLKGRVSPYASDKSFSEAVSTLIKTINVRRKKHRQPPISRPPNGARHCYGSYRYPVLNGNAALLASEMGNSPREVIRDYREVVNPRWVPEYWAITRPRPGNVEQLDFALAG